LSISAISKRYAKALVNMGAEQQAVESYGVELGQVRTAFATVDLLRLILESPTFPMEKKSAILGELMDSMKLSEGMRKFLGLLLEKDRLQYLAQIEGDFCKLADQLSGTLRATIYSATELTDQQREAIRKGLEKQSGKTVELKVEVKPALIGGIQVEIGGKLFDGSLTTQLKRIEDTLKKG